MSLIIMNISTMGDTWGNTSASLTLKQQAVFLPQNCGIPARPTGTRGCCERPTWQSTAMYGGNPSSQSYLLGQLQRLESCGGIYVNTTRAIPDTANCQATSLLGLDYNKYATSQSRFEMYQRRDPLATVCPPTPTEQLNSTMPKTVVQKYCTNVIGITPAPS